MHCGENWPRSESSDVGLEIVKWIDNLGNITSRRAVRT
jgi:hypothetical protein